MEENQSSGSHKARTKCCCAHCGASSEHEAGTCTVTMQYGDEEETCVVCQAEYPRRETKSVMEALIMCTRKMCALTKWEFTEGCLQQYGPHGVNRTGLQGRRCLGADVRANIVVKPVAAPIASDPWEVHDTSHMLMECNTGAQRSFLAHNVGTHRRVSGGLRSHTLWSWPSSGRYGANATGRLNRLLLELTLSPTSWLRRVQLRPLPVLARSVKRRSS